MYKKIISHRLFKNTSALLIMQLFMYVAPLLVLPYLSRVLSPDGFGLMVAALSLIIVANVCTDFGFNLSATYLISRKRGRRAYASKILSAIYILKIPILAVVFIATSIYLIAVPMHTLTAIISIYIAIFFNAFLSPWLFQGIEKMKFVTYSTVVSRVVYVVLVLMLVKDKNDYDLVMVMNAIASILAATTANVLIAREGIALTKPTARLMKMVINHSSQFFLSRVALQMSSSVSVLVLSSYVTPAQTGLYGASNKLFDAFKNLINPFTQALYPYMANTGNKKLLFKVTIAVGLLMLFPAVIGLVYAEEIVTLIYGNEFIDSAPLLRIFVIAGVLAFFSIMYGYPAFASIKRVDLANKSVIIGGLIQVLSLCLLMVLSAVTITNVAYSVLFYVFITLSIRIYWFLKYRK